MDLKHSDAASVIKVLRLSHFPKYSASPLTTPDVRIPALTLLEKLASF